MCHECPCSLGQFVTLAWSVAFALGLDFVEDWPLIDPDDQAGDVVKGTESFFYPQHWLLH